MLNNYSADGNIIRPDHAIELPEPPLSEGDGMTFKHNAINGQPVADENFVKVTEPPIQHPFRPVDGEIEEVTDEPSTLSAALDQAVGHDNPVEGITDEEVDFVPEPAAPVVEEPVAIESILETTPNRYRNIIR